MDEDLARVEREFDAELLRVGVSIDEVLDELTPAWPAGAAGVLRAVGFDLARAMPVLRSLPDGAGGAAFLARCRKHLISFGGHRFDSD